jgi:hypothetical protein
VLQECRGLIEGLAIGSNFFGKMGTSPQGGNPGALKSKAKLFPLSKAQSAPLMDGMNCPRSKEMSCKKSSAVFEALKKTRHTRNCDELQIYRGHRE